MTQDMTQPTIAYSESSVTTAQQKMHTSPQGRAAPATCFLHITGADDYERVKELTKDIDGYKVVSFCDDMATAYAACDSYFSCRSL